MMARARHARRTTRWRSAFAVALLVAVLGNLGVGIALHNGWRPLGRPGGSQQAPPSARTTTRPTPTRPRSAASTYPQQATRYTVKPGDTLWDIAQAFRVRGRVVTLYEWNRSVIGRNPDLIFPGQVIIVDPTGKISAGR